VISLASTIKDVAKRAGVSVATVSRVINRLGGVKADTERRILRAMEDLHYVPNVLARSVAAQKTQLISMIIPDIRNPFFAAVYTGANLVARNLSYTTLLGDSGDDVNLEEDLLRTSLEHRASGIILTPVCEEPGWMERVHLDLPVCLVDRDLSGIECDKVLIDNQSGTDDATRLLLSNGHTRIGIITGPLDSTPGKQRFDGYAKRMRDAGLPLEDGLIKVGDFREGSGYQLGLDLLRMKDRPSAILSCNNLMTMGLLEAINASGLQIGKDIAVVGFDDIPIATLMNPKLTVVSRPMQEMGEWAAKLLLDRIHNPDAAVRQILMRPHLIVRGSETVRA
jgi:LacI family transcriptional regulator